MIPVFLTIYGSRRLFLALVSPGVEDDVYWLSLMTATATFGTLVWRLVTTAGDGVTCPSAPPPF